MELVLPLLDPERGLLGPGLELLAHPPEVVLGVAIGFEGLDPIVGFVEISFENLTAAGRRMWRASERTLLLPQVTS